MYTNAEIQSKIEEIEQSNHTIQNVQKLASLYIVQDHMNQPRLDGYSGDKPRADAVIEGMGGSEFLNKVNGRSWEELLPIINELVDVVMVKDRRLYRAFMKRL